MTPVSAKSNISDRVEKLEDSINGDDGLTVKVAIIHEKVKNIPGVFTMFGYILTFCGILGTGIFFLLKNQQAAVTADLKLFVMQNFADDNSNDTKAVAVKSLEVQVANR